MEILAWIVFTIIFVIAFAFLLVMLALLIDRDEKDGPGSDEIWNDLEDLEEYE